MSDSPDLRVAADEVIPVLVVGAGPVGLALTIELARRGVRSITVDQSDGVIRFPTGESLSTRTMEHFRRWDIADIVRFSGFPPTYRRNVRFVTRVMGYQLAVFERTGNAEQGSAESAVSPEGSAWCPKFFLDPILRDYAASFVESSVRLGWRFTSLVESDDGVLASLTNTDSGEERRIFAEYVAGCDGGASVVRQATEIELDGGFAEGQNLGIYFRAPTLLRDCPHGEASQYWLTNRDGRGPLSAVDGRETWRLSIEYPREELPNVAAASVVRAALGGDIPFDVLNVSPWAGHRVVAERYRKGRVFLAGDACHLMWPRGGFGLNTGIGDAVDLGWKLAATLQGWGGRALLDSYEVERKPVGWRNVNTAAANRRAEFSFEIPAELEDDTEAGARERARLAQVIEDVRRKEWASLGIQLGYRYESAICVADGAAAPSDDPSVYEPTSRPGCRAPHAWVAQRRSTLDLLGDGFSLLRFRGGVSTAELEEAARSVGLPLRVVDVKDPGAAELYERSLVLVRPDGHVAWRDDAEPADAAALIDQVRGAQDSPSSR